MATTL